MAPVEGFAAIPNWLIRDKSFSWRDRAVYMVLASRTGREGTWAMSLEQIADEADMSVSSVQRARTALRLAGAISWETPVAETGKGKAVYRVHSSVQRPTDSRTGQSDLTAGPVNLTEPTGQSDLSGSVNLTSPADLQEPETRIGQSDQSGPVTLTDRKKNRSSVVGSVGISPSSVKSSSEPQAAPTRPEIEHLCTLLAELIEANGSRRPTITKKWRDSARLLIDRDGISPDRIERAIRWSQANDFWRGNVMSMPKLREHYDRLRLDAAREASSGGALRIPTTAARVQAGLSLVEELRAEETQAHLMIGGTA